MKEWKTEIINEIIRQAEGCRIVSLYEVGKSLGHKHICSQDCRDIIMAAAKALPDFKVFKMVAPRQSRATASLWTTATFICNELEFDDGDEFDDWGEI